MDFSSGLGGVQFSDIGMTSGQTGVTASVTMFQVSTGATTITSFNPMPLNYILGSDMTGSPTLFRGSSYQTATNGVVSLTTNSSRIVEITLISLSGSGWLQLSGSEVTSQVGYLRVLRGLSTFVEGNAFGNLLAGISSDYFYRYPTSAFRFYDLAPITGAATYILQVQTDGLSTVIQFNSAALFVRQL